MNLKSNEIKLRKNKRDSKLSSAQFSLTYKQQKSKSEMKKQIYDIISTLKGKNDVLIEMNSSLFSVRNEKNAYVKKFINSIRKLDLDYRYSKVPAKNNQSILSNFLGKEDNEHAHEILTFVPHDIWTTETFQKIIPLCGIRYYITKDTVEKIDGEELLNKMSRMMDSEKLDYFKFTVFDGGQLGNMGINSNHLSLNDIKQLLNL